MSRKRSELDPSAREMRRWVEMTMNYIVPYFKDMEKIPMRDSKDLEILRKKIREPIPLKSTKLEKLLPLIFEDLLPKGLQVPSPGYLAYIPVGSLFHSVLGEFISFAINRWPGLYQIAPGFVEMENTVIRWLSEMMGMPSTTGGILTSGGSLANFSAIVTARHTKLGEKFSKGTIYFSEQTHHSIEKSARLAGFPKVNLRSVSCDSEYRISVAQLEKMIAQDRSRGLQPIMVVGNAGTTGTGAIDDLVGIHKICRKENMWFHVDAAWAGTLRLTTRGKKLLKGTELADSLTIDPHKALYTPFGCGALLVREPRHLMAAHSFEASYLPGESEEEALMSPSKLSPELSRGLRGLQVWLPIKMMGIKPFKIALEEKLKLTDWITAELKKMKHIKIMFEPQTAIVGFRFEPPGKTIEALNSLNRALLDAINSHGRVLLSGMELNGEFTIRIIPFGQRTHLKELKMVRDYIRNEVVKYTKL